MLAIAHGVPIEFFKKVDIYLLVKNVDIYHLLVHI